MKLAAHYSHLNGKECLLVHHKKLWDEVQGVIAGINISAHLTNVSQDNSLYFPKNLNEAFETSLDAYGWSNSENTHWDIAEEKIPSRLPKDMQRQAIEEAEDVSIVSYNQMVFLKERVAVDIQFDKYAFAPHDLFVKHLGLYVSDIIDVGIEILPMRELERKMSPGAAYYEKNLLNVMQRGRGVPAVPLVLIGVTS